MTRPRCAEKGAMTLDSDVPLEQAHTQFDQAAFNDDCETGGGGSSPRLDNDGDEKSERSSWQNDDGRHGNGVDSVAAPANVCLLRVSRDGELRCPQRTRRGRGALEGARERETHARDDGAAGGEHAISPALSTLQYACQVHASSLARRRPVRRLWCGAWWGGRLRSVAFV